MVDLKGKRVLIVGAGGGIGQAIARELEALGARLALADLQPEVLKNELVFMQKEGHGHLCFPIDVRDRQSVQWVSDQVEQAWGGYDAVVSNAGVSTMVSTLELTDEDWDFNFDVNVRGMFLVNQIAIRQFIRQKIAKASIVNTASLAAKMGAPFLAHYSASKFAVVGLTQAVAREFASHGIRINAVCPGFVKTAMQAREVEWEASLRGISAEQVRQSYIDQTPLGRLEEPEDVSRVVAFLLSESAGFMTGQSINVTGGVFMQ